MSFISKVFGRNRKSTNVALSPECEKIEELEEKISNLLTADHYVARSEYIPLLSDYKETVEYFNVLSKSGMLQTFCAQNNLKETKVQQIIYQYSNLMQCVDDANESYIHTEMLKEKEYLDNILKDVDPVISLDEDQRRVILTDEDYCLVIAGAGAGKTTTVAAKVKYLVEKKNINPRDILVISFTNKAVGELRERINKDLDIDCPIATFHSTGNAILHINNPEQLNVVDGSKLYFLILDYFKASIM